MANPIKITFDGTEYTLEYSRRTVKQMERAGVQISEKAIDEEPVTAVENLFVGAFLMHHKNIKQEQTDRIWSGIENKEDLIKALIELYNAPINSYMEEPGESTKKATWTQV